MKRPSEKPGYKTMNYTNRTILTLISILLHANLNTYNYSNRFLFAGFEISDTLSKSLISTWMVISVLMELSSSISHSSSDSTCRFLVSKLKHEPSWQCAQRYVQCKPCFLQLHEASTHPFLLQEHEIWSSNFWGIGGSVVPINRFPFSCHPQSVGLRSVFPNHSFSW